MFKFELAQCKVAFESMYVYAASDDANLEELTEKYEALCGKYLDAKRRKGRFTFTPFTDKEFQKLIEKARALVANFKN